MKRGLAKRAKTSHRDNLEIEDLPPTLMTAPLDWLAAEHQRHRQFCLLLSGFASARAFDAEQARKLLAFMAKEFAFHVAEEEEDLFPLLQRRALREDNIEAALSRLVAEHRAEAAQAEKIQVFLKNALESRTAPALDPAAVVALSEFASSKLRHLALENAVILPIARLRLSGRDLAVLGRQIATRRCGVTAGATA